MLKLLRIMFKNVEKQAEEGFEFQKVAISVYVLIYVVAVRCQAGSHKVVPALAERAILLCKFCFRISQKLCWPLIYSTV